MVNLTDYRELLVEEGILAQSSGEMVKKIKNKKAMSDLQKLAQLSMEKIKILYVIVKNTP